MPVAEALPAEGGFSRNIANMKLQVLSDLHVEAHNSIPPPAAEADVVVLAGDLAPYHPRILNAVADAWRAAEHILYVPGNHEFYHGEIDHVRAGLAKTCAELGIELLDRRSIHIGGVRFVGATLWTDFELEGLARVPWAKQVAARAMSDFVGAIHHRGGLFTPTESCRRHSADRAFIERELQAAEAAGEVAVVITHHAPTPRSIRPWFQGNALNPAFASDLERLIDRYTPPLWIHGHMHDSIDEALGDTRVLANPGGYTKEENPLFDPALCVEV